MQERRKAGAEGAANVWVSFFLHFQPAATEVW